MRIRNTVCKYGIQNSIYTLAGTGAWDGFFDITYPRYRIRIETFLVFVELWLLLAYSVSAPRFFNYLWAVREQNAIKIFSLPNRPNSLCVFSLCAKWVRSQPWNKEVIWNGHGYRQSHWVRLTVTVCILFCSWWEYIEYIPEVKAAEAIPWKMGG